ncbi:gluconolactonase [Sinomicrobium oceani]|uniref:Gluconolactonase n=1 Tax=Sinomicrobium oceani TaxID=1150368 RepID=A0A1K1R1N3_9FLAO|nr:SMP-30/gluconolactonase/LRE family protein [Sinomicrobium oceani]SFW65494.1 gluconolactonase [Sinomicrobium oceani]
MKASLLIPILIFIINPVTAQKISGYIERLDPDLDAIVKTNAEIAVIAEGFTWSEGPLWIESEQMLLFSDVPENTIFKWTETGGKEVYLRPSGYTGTTPSKSKEPGSNGLLLDTRGNLVLCQHGNRQMARMKAPLNNPKPVFETLADRYKGKKFSSPNDAVYNSSGALFFTDPPYGLPMQNDDDPAKEIDVNGVYKLKENGEIVLLTGKITRPNGIAFFPGEQKLLVASSDPGVANWYLLDPEKTGQDPELFYSATNERKGLKGLPDGLKIDKKGNVYASGPGGIWIFDKNAKVLGKIRLEESASNVALSDDEKILYITNDMYVVRVRLR